MDGMYTVWNNGKVVRFTNPSGSAASAAPPAPNLEFFLGSLATSPLHDRKGSSFLVVGTKSGSLQAHDRKTGALAWSLPLQGLAKNVAEVEGDLLVTLEGGALLRARTDPPAVLWKRQLASAGEIEAHALGKSIAVVTRKNDLIFLKAADGVTALAQSFPLSSRLCVAPTEDRIFLLDKGGEIFMLASESGSVLKARALQVKHRSIAAIPGGLAIVLDDKRSCLFVDASTLEPLWVVRVAADITTVAATDSLIVIVSVDGTLAAYRR
jgi:hypothetical protein